MKRCRVALLVLTLLTVFLFSFTTVKSPAQAAANTGNMIMEHIGMGCGNCHGKAGPKGMMMEHKDIECGVCHQGASVAVKPAGKPHEKEAVPLSSAMIMEHEDMGCATCHGKAGPKGMMMEHQGMACTICHADKGA